jgi:hypothetical protein
MQGRPPVAFGSGAYVAGVVGAAALLAGRPSETVAAIAVGGFCLGIVAGGLLVTRTRLLDHSASGRVTGLALVTLGAWVTWTGVQSGAGGRYQFTMGSVFVAIIGWALMARAGGASRLAEGNPEILATLPRTTDSESVTDGRRGALEHLTDVGTLVVVGYFFYRAVVRADPSSWLFGGLFLAVFLPGTRSRVRLTEGGVETTRYVFWLVPFDLASIPWEGVYGYESTDDRLRIATDYGPGFSYDPDSIDDIELVRGILDDHLPRL